MSISFSPAEPTTHPMPNPSLTPTPDRPSPLLARWGEWGWPAYLFLFALLLASSPVRTQPVWNHLVNGRDMLALRFQFLTPEWLFDVVSYLVYSVGGGFAWVGLKAVGVGVLGVLLYRTALTAGSAFRLLPAICAGLAVLALSGWATLRPATASYLFLGLMFWLVRPGAAPARPGIPWRLIALFLIWANTDRGFVTGLLLLAAVGLGRRLDRGAGFGWVSWWPLAVLGAALANPTHLTRFPLPAELGWLVQKAGSTWQAVFGDPAYTAPRSPFTADYLKSVADNPAALAFYALLGFSALAFALNLRRLRWERFLPWAVAVLLTVVTDRAIPVFAVVAGPILAHNLADLLAARGADPAARRGWQWAVPVGILGAAFLLAAWPGWLNAPPYGPRRWALDWSKTLEAAGAKLTADRTGGRTLHLSAESARAFAWFAPTDDGAFDPDLAGLFDGQLLDPDELLKRRFTRVLVYHPDLPYNPTLEAVQRPLRTLLSDPDRWPLLFVRGGVAVFGVHDPAAGPPARGLDLSDPWFDLADPERAAVPLADGSRPADAGGWASVRAMFTEPAPAPSVHRDEAAMLLALARASQAVMPTRNVNALPVELMAGLTGAGASGTNPMAAAADLALRMTYLNPPPSEPGKLPPVARYVVGFVQTVLANKPATLPGPLSAAVRAGRRAVADTPTDPNAHLLLGEAYLTTMEASREFVWSSAFRKVAELRQAEAVAAYEQGVRLSRTPPAAAHRRLAEMYEKLRYLDVALDHLTAARQARRLTGEAGEADAKWFDQLSGEVARQRERYADTAAGQLVGGRAVAANALGLKRLALDELRPSNIDAFGRDGAMLQLDLALRTGQAEQVIAWLSPEGEYETALRTLLGPANFHWYRAQALAATGATGRAATELAAIGAAAAPPASLLSPEEKARWQAMVELASTPNPALLGQVVAEAVGRQVLGEAPQTGGLPDAVGRVLAQAETARELDDRESQLRRLAEVSILRAVLASEVGDVAAVKEYAAAAAAFSPVRGGGVKDVPRLIAEELLGQVEGRK